MNEVRSEPKHFPLIYAAAPHIGTSRPTLYRTLSGGNIGPVQARLISAYRAYVLAHLDKVAPEPKRPRRRSARTPLEAGK